MIDDNYIVTVDPAEEPVTLVETKNWLRVTTSADDTLITSLIVSARRFGEKFCNRIFVNTTFECYFSGLDSSNCEPLPFIQIRRAPLSSITSLETYDGGSYGATTDYLVKDVNGFSRLIFENGATFDDSGIVYPLKLTAVFGYGAAADVPDDIKTAIFSHVAFWYENRGDAVATGNLSMPLETKSIYTGKYRILNTYG